MGFWEEEGPRLPHRPIRNVASPTLILTSFGSSFMQPVVEIKLFWMSCLQLKVQIARR